MHDLRAETYCASDWALRAVLFWRGRNGRRELVMTTIHTIRHAIELLREAAQNTFAKQLPDVEVDVWLDEEGSIRWKYADGGRS